MLSRRSIGAALCLGFGAANLRAPVFLAQSPTTPSPTAPQTPSPQTPPPQPNPPAQSQGTVLFQSHGDPPAAVPEATDPNRRLLTVPAQEPASAGVSGGSETPGAAKGSEFTDLERSALLFTAYDLDARLTPATGKLTMRARVTVENTGEAPLQRIALQVSSSLMWESVSLLAPAGAQPLALAQHLIDTDTDHTGKANEVVLELPGSLDPGRSITLDTFYSGSIAQSAERLLRIGANDTQAAAADWDGIGPGGVWLRGFGNVLWYPVSAPQLFLGDGARLFDAVDRSRLVGQAATVRLRLRVEYTGDPPTAAYFCGRRAAFAASSDAPDAPIAASAGVATAEFSAEPLGFRFPSLFVIARPEELTGALPGELAGGQPMLAVETKDAGLAPSLGTAAERLAPLLQQWLSARPLSALTVLDHPGQPFQDGPLLVAPGAALTTSDAEPALTASMARAWVQTGQPWVDEGLAQFFALLHIEQQRGRDAMVAQLAELIRPLAQAEAPPPAEGSAPAQAPVGQPLVAAGAELYYRRKAAAVWLMLRELVGDQALQVTLGAWRSQTPPKDGSRPTAEQDALALEWQLEKNSGKDLHRFFDDWVLHDHGLPDLSLAEVTPRQLSVQASERSDHNPGWLTVVTVTNAGSASVDVPVIVSAGGFSTTVRLLVPPASVATPGSATARVQTESSPTAVQVNDGITPELHSSVHRREVHGR